MNHQSFLDELIEIIGIVDTYLKERGQGSRGEGTVKDLITIKQELENIEHQVRNDQLPPKPRDRLFSAYIALNYWHEKDDLLGDRICGLDILYRDL